MPRVTKDNPRSTMNSTKENTNVDGGRPNRYAERNGWKMTDARNLHLPTLAIVGLIGFFVWLTYIGVSERARLDNRIDALMQHDRYVSKSLTELAVEYKSTIDNMLFQFKQDRTIWCLRAQQHNKSWECPPFPERRMKRREFNIPLLNEKKPNPNF